MGDVLEGQPEHLRLFVADDVAEPTVHPEPAPVGAHVGHAHRCLLEGRLEALLALSMPSLPLLQLLGALRNSVFEVPGKSPDLFFRPLAGGDIAYDGEHVAFTILSFTHQPDRAEGQFNVDLLAALS